MQRLADCIRLRRGSSRSRWIIRCREQLARQGTCPGPRSPCCSFRPDGQPPRQTRAAARDEALPGFAGKWRALRPRLRWCDSGTPHLEPCQIRLRRIAHHPCRRPAQPSEIACAPIRIVLDWWAAEPGNDFADSVGEVIGIFASYPVLSLVPVRQGELCSVLHELRHQLFCPGCLDRTQGPLT